MYDVQVWTNEGYTILKMENFQLFRRIYHGKTRDIYEGLLK